MRVGDLVKVHFAEGAYYGMLLHLDPYPPPSLGHDWTILFCDGDIETYSQQALDFDEIRVEVVNESR